MEIDNTEKYLILFIVSTIVIITIRTYYGDNYAENFKANDIANQNAELRDNITDDYLRSQTHLAVNYLRATEFIVMVLNIKDIIVEKIIGFGKTCQQMNGADGFFDEKNSMTLACHTESYTLEEDILEDVYNYIYNVIKKKFNINMNYYAVINDLKRHLNLIEGIIYPLKFSGLYTVHGTQYTTPRSIKNMINTNLDVKDVLYTILSRRNIVLEIDTDQHIQ